MNKSGFAGCGCLIFVLVVIMVLTGVLIHPMTLRFIGNQFHYEDKIFASDAIFVPRFPEDRNGELYLQALREYAAGNGKIILVEDETILGTSVYELVVRMARSRNVNEGGVRKLPATGQELDGTRRIQALLERQGFRKVIILVPEYASRRFHIIYGNSAQEGKIIYLVRPVSTTHFKKDKWWKDGEARGLLAREAIAIGSFYLQRFKHGEKEGKDSKER